MRCEQKQRAGGERGGDFLERSYVRDFSGSGSFKVLEEEHHLHFGRIFKILDFIELRVVKGRESELRTVRERLGKQAK